VARALVDLEMLAEGVTSAGFEPTPIHGGDEQEPGGKRPPGGPSTLDWHVSELVQWCKDAEETVKRETGRVARPAAETTEQFHARLLREHAGKRDDDVARIERTSRTNVRKIRERGGRDPLYGRKKRAAGGRSP
jgi:hypothetical protein